MLSKFFVFAKVTNDIIPHIMIPQCNFNLYYSCYICDYFIRFGAIVLNHVNCFPYHLPTFSLKFGNFSSYFSEVLYIGSGRSNTS